MRCFDEIIFRVLLMVLGGYGGWMRESVSKSGNICLDRYIYNIYIALIIAYLSLMFCLEITGDINKHWMKCVFFFFLFSYNIYIYRRFAVHSYYAYFVVGVVAILSFWWNIWKFSQFFDRSFSCCFCSPLIHHASQKR